ncbi:MAG: GtrA family protein [Clostridia bacterium]|nr:GtrA family protein [Clostridia bacterium]
MIQRIWQFVKFGIVGVSNTAISYAVYLLCVKLGVHYVIADGLGLVISTINAYYWNNRCVFGDGTKKTFREHFVTWLKTLTAYGGTFVLNSLMLILWVEILHVPEAFAPLLNLLITIPVNFVINKYWTFRKKP